MRPGTTNTSPGSVVAVTSDEVNSFGSLRPDASWSTLGLQPKPFAAQGRFQGRQLQCANILDQDQNTAHRRRSGVTCCPNHARRYSQRAERSNINSGNNANPTMRLLRAGENTDKTSWALHILRRKLMGMPAPGRDVSPGFACYRCGRKD